MYRQDRESHAYVDAACYDKIILLSLRVVEIVETILKVLAVMKKL